ncbi:MAG: cation:proton antiporter [Micromonosporaceae bacterium]
MEDVFRFAVVVTLVAAALSVAVFSSRLSELIRVPAPAVFLVAAAIASDLVPALGVLSVEQVQRIVTVALIVILFDGGMRVGWRRFRSAAGPIITIGVVGTFLTAAAVAVLAHGLFGFGWRAALLIGAALAPTDPAVVFSVLGKREVTGRSSVILEGESGANDPVGIALMASLLVGSVGSGVGEFALEMMVGAAVGLILGYGLLVVVRRVALPSEPLYPLRTLAGAALIYGVATLLHGSGFLAVFVAGIMLGDARAPYKGEIRRVHASLASLGEIVAFTVLGLTVNLRQLFTSDAWWIGLALAALLALLVRPLLVGPLLVPVRLRRGEKVFVLWAGLKGAVPILLGTFVFAAGVVEATLIYHIIFMVVLFSVIVQGGLVPWAARRCAVPMRLVQPAPWSLGVRFRHEPQGLRRFVVAGGSPADGRALDELELGSGVWVSVVSRGGALLALTGETRLRAGDEVLVLTDPAQASDPTSVFNSR